MFSNNPLCFILDKFGFALPSELSELNSYCGQIFYWYITDDTISLINSYNHLNFCSSIECKITYSWWATAAEDPTRCQVFLIKWPLSNFPEKYRHVKCFWGSTYNWKSRSKFWFIHHKIDVWLLNLHVWACILNHRASIERCCKRLTEHWCKSSL